MKIEIKLDYARIRQIEQAAKQAAIEALEILDADLVNSYTMPFDTGNMQGGGTYTYTYKSGSRKGQTKTGPTVKGNEVVDFSEGDEIHVCLTNDAPQARRLYYHPEYNFQQGNNANAGAKWLEPYISGSKKEFVQAKFTEIFRRRAGL